MNCIAVVKSQLNAGQYRLAADNKYCTKDCVARAVTF